jgi:putative hemolysin
MLPRELFNKRGQRLHVHIGQPIPFAQLRAIDHDAELMHHLRHRTYLLAHRPDTQLPPRPTPTAIAPQPIIDPVPPALIAAEVAALPPAAFLVGADELAVYCTGAEAIPHTLREIARLRELTFRATGEGTGKRLDLDRFDANYLHLFVYHRESRQVVGAYRLGPTDLLRGRESLYTSTLFDYKPSLLSRLGPALEVGRSFIRAEYQRSFAPLLLLWKGIGHYVVRHPRYRVLFGPVSISNNYRSVSRQLMVQFFKTHHALADLADSVRPRRPFRPDKLAASATSHAAPPAEADTLSSLVADLEPDHKGIPVLLRQYLKLGAKFLAFNVDADFSDVLDALIYVDLMRTDTRALDKYMTKAGAALFRAHHAMK